jgi:predicted dehydrogenase
MSKQQPAAVGLIGCGNISSIYLQNAQILDAIEIVACADLRREAAEAQAAKYGVGRVLSVEELLADPSIEIVLNLTTPESHGAIALAALEAGKSVYNEKPLAMSRDEARRMLELAGAKGLLVGGAPDTFLGAGLQTVRELIDAGAIGEIVGANAFMMSRGHEHWHPNPVFYYKAGGGPLFDMGPYYLTALVALLGPVRRISGATRISRPTRTITSQPRYGEVITVDVPTHIAGLLDFAAGPVGMIMTTFDVQASALPNIEIYGTQGTISAPDPNTFGGPVKLRRTDDKEWQEVPVTRPYAANSRGLGLAGMAAALHGAGDHRASGELAYHVLDLMHAIHEASDSGCHVQVESTCERPPAMAI